MRIHTKLTLKDLAAALPKGVYFTRSTEHGSRVAEHAYEIQLSGSSNRHQNNGDWNSPNAATWDEWGTFLAGIYLDDSEALCGSKSNPIYANDDDFHFKTGDRFTAKSLPEDTHQDHRWEYVGQLATGVAKHKCTRCSAVQQHHC